MKVIKPEEGEIFDIELEEDFLKRNRELAAKNRELLDRQGIKAIDVMGSIGSGKTSLIIQIVNRLKERHKIAVITGDTATTIDAERVKSSGASVVQINTGKECHLDANLVKKALSQLDLRGIGLLFIENVGNLICPADFPLGSHLRVVVLAVTEGPYIVMKHPFVFIEADMVVVNKMDLSGATGIQPATLEEQVLRVKPTLKVARTNCVTGEGVEKVIGLLGL